MGGVKDNVWCGAENKLWTVMVKRSQASGLGLGWWFDQKAV
jgi:hypothetical protein